MADPKYSEKSGKEKSGKKKSGKERRQFKHHFLEWLCFSKEYFFTRKDKNKNKNIRSNYWSINLNYQKEKEEEAEEKEASTFFFLIIRMYLLHYDDRECRLITHLHWLFPTNKLSRMKWWIKLHCQTSLHIQVKLNKKKVFIFITCKL